MDPKRRMLFADFLERLADGDIETGEWQEFAVTHYRDESLERVRRDCVRLCIQKPERGWSEQETDQIREWARELRRMPG